MGKNIKSKRKGINNRSRTRRQRGGGPGGDVINPSSTLPGHAILSEQLNYIQDGGITKVALEAPVKVALEAPVKVATAVAPTEVQVSPLVLAKIAINIELFENDGIKLKPFTIGCFRNFKQYGSPHTELIFSDNFGDSAEQKISRVNEISRFADCFQNVELLDLRNTEITKLPMNFSKLISLKCLLLPETIISNNFYDLAVKVQTLRYIEVPGFFEKEKKRIETKMNPELTQEQKNEIMAKDIAIEGQTPEQIQEQINKKLANNIAIAGQTPEQIQEQKQENNNRKMAEGWAQILEITALEEKIKQGEVIEIDSDILKLFDEDEKIYLNQLKLSQTNEQPKITKLSNKIKIISNNSWEKDVIRILSNKKTELKIKNFRIPPDDSVPAETKSVDPDSGIIFEAPSLLEQFREDPVKKQDIKTEQDIKITQIVTDIENKYSGKILCFPPSWPIDYEPSLIVSSEEESIYAK
jgi:hypothetical protein